MLLPLVVHPNVMKLVFPEVKALNIVLLQHVNLSDDPTLVAELSLNLSIFGINFCLESIIAGLGIEFDVPYSSRGARP